MIERLGPVNYRIRRSNRTEPFVVHVDKLKMYISSESAIGAQINFGDSERIPVFQDNSSSGDDDRTKNENADVVAEGSNDEYSEVSRRRLPPRLRRLPSRYLQ